MDIPMTPDPWAPYKPSDSNPWDRRKVGHLYRRAGFGATLEELIRGVADGPEKTIDRLLKGERQDPDFESTSEFMAGERSLPPGAPQARLAAWWLDRILKTKHPLEEKMTLFWHNHFATSNAKVQNARYMLTQYRTLKTHALGSFPTLVHAMTYDPAMMVWLDTVESKKGKPNENYARELMELFTLGIGPYTEADVREAARAFTGYEIADGKGTFNPKQHDTEAKTVMGGKVDKAEAVVDRCLARPECPRFVAKKLYRYLVSDAESVDAGLLQSLADKYRESKFETGKLVETILRSEHFFSPVAYRAKVKSPVEFVAGIVRGLEGTAGPLPLAQAMDGLGQVLFAPPSVKGWDGGPAWLNGQTLLFRQNLALALTSGDDARFGTRCDPVEFMKQNGAESPKGAADSLLEVFLQGDVSAATRTSVIDSITKAEKAKQPPYRSRLDAGTHARKAAAHLVLTLPEFQLN
jgi:uncharacterized protein (DUF1800 family)